MMGAKKGDGQGENNGESVAIIGGADGPTEIVIAEEEEDKNEEQQPMKNNNLKILLKK